MKISRNFFQVGWGKSEGNKRHEESIPREVSLRAVNDTYCYTTDSNIAQISSPRTFCAGGENTGPCHGDSGSISCWNTFQILLNGVTLRWRIFR